MRIVFCVADLEPGRDGVGDYARTLAAECASRGHHCMLLALNDRHIAAQVYQAQSEGGATLETLRLPSLLPWSQRAILARQWLDSERPDWVSLQFVAYGFHPKGLIGRIGGHLAHIVDGWPLHLMLHELWLGMQQRGVSWKHRLVGNLQRRAILSLIESLRPSVIHTSNVTYATLLQRLNVEAGVLPLFGNIPITECSDPDWLGSEIAKLGVPADRARSREIWRFGVFGSVHPTWSPEPLLTLLADAAEGRDMIVASIGRIGTGEAVWQSMRARYGGPFSFVSLGERTVEEVSAFLQSVDFGIATTPWQLIGKSGSTAAMLDHGLPVIVARDDQDFGISPSSVVEHPLLYRMDADLPQWLTRICRQPSRSRLPEVAVRFLDELAEKHP